MDGQADNAIQKCSALRYNAVVSNQCFEVWFLLHYNFFDSALHRNEIFKHISVKIDKNYTKNKTMDMYTLLKNQIKTALRNAVRLENSYTETSIANRNPYTMAHTLVNRLYELKSEATTPGIVRGLR